MTTPPLPNPNPTASQNFAMPAKKSKGCSCCFVGCLFLVVLLIILLIGTYFGFRYSSDIIFSDSVVTWTYQNVARPKIEQMLPSNMSPAEKQTVLAQADQAMSDFATLSVEEKRVLRKEGLTALYYYSQNQIIPPEKIPHLIQFIEKEEKALREKGNTFNPTPRLTQ